MFGRGFGGNGGWWLVDGGGGWLDACFGQFWAVLRLFRGGFCSLLIL